jgi:hypothetical protein
MVLLTIRYFGVPRILFADRGSIYVAKVVKLLFKLYGMKVRYSASYHHRTVGHLERWHSTLKTFLLALRKARPNCDLSVYIGWLNLAYNSSVHSLTKYSPSFLMTLRLVRLPHDLLFSPPAVSKNIPEWVKESLEVLGLAYDRVTQSLHLHALANLKKCDLRRDPLLAYQVGDLVILIKGDVVDKNLPKDQFPTRGPYFIAKVLPNDNYILGGIDARRLAPVNVDRLLPHPKPRPPDILTSPVSRIVDHRWKEHTQLDNSGKPTTVKTLEYRLRWAGLSSSYDSFRSLAYLADIPQLVQAYNRRAGDAIPEGYRYFEEPAELDRARPPLSEAALRRPHFRHRPQHSTEGDSAIAPAEPPSTAEEDSPAAAPAPIPSPGGEQVDTPVSRPTTTSDDLPISARCDRKGRWTYLRRFITKRGTQERWIGAREFQQDSLDSDLFTQLRAEHLAEQKASNQLAGSRFVMA